MRSRAAASISAPARPDDRRHAPGGLRQRHELVDLALPVGGRAEDERAGHVRVVPIDGRAEVQLHEVAGGEHCAGRPVMRNRAVGAGRHDRLERRVLRTQHAHPLVEIQPDLPLGPAGTDPARVEQIREGSVGDERTRWTALRSPPRPSPRAAARRDPSSGAGRRAGRRSVRRRASPGPGGRRRSAREPRSRARPPLGRAAPGRRAGRSGPEGRGPPRGPAWCTAHPCRAA